jgi:P-type Mg2+ transporter
MIPADGILILAKDFHVQQSALTGESLPVEKSATYSKIESEQPTEIVNLIFAGTSVVSGTATAVILVTGKDTLLGQIVKNLGQSPPQTGI